MLKNYFKIAFRNLVKYKVFTFINIFGLASGIACFILIFSFLINELTYDTFNKNADSIYRIYSIEKSPAGIEKKVETPDPLADALNNDYPKLLNAVSISYGNEFPVTINNRSFKEKIFEADAGLFSMFSFPFSEGNPETALKDVSSVVITYEVAKKYFGNENPMGKIILLLNKYPLKITGVLQKIPANSSIQLNIIVSSNLRNTIIPGYKKQWHSSGQNTFVQCLNGFNAAELNNSLKTIREKYLPDFLKARYNYGIQPLSDIHLASDIPGGIVSPVSITYLYGLLAIALAVLIIACINFMNLTASRSVERAKEISIRKVLGSKKSQLVIQFLNESILLSFAALIIGIAIAEIFLPEFNRLTGKDLEIFKFTALRVAGLFLLGLIVGILPGLYPAFRLTSSCSIEKIKNNSNPAGRSNLFGKILLSAQFVICIILITCILVIRSQVHFMKNADLGFNKTNIAVIQLTDDTGTDMHQEVETYIKLINEKMQSSGIISISASEHTPGYYYNNQFGVIPEGSAKSQAVTMLVTSFDDNFLNTYGIKLIEGSNFSDIGGMEQFGSVLINETALKKLGWRSAIGKTIMFAHGDGPYKIIGVIKDIHYKSMLTGIEPLVIRYAGFGYYSNFLSVRISSAGTSGSLAELRSIWQNIFPGRQFEYFFIDEKYGEAYKSEEKIEEITGIFSFIAVLLACLGLLGLIILTIANRTKEIGIHKVLGASVPDIILLISKQFIKIILISDILAIPAAWYLMNSWLQDYPYRINLDITFFISSTFIVLAAALLTICFQTVKAAIANPVDSLKYE